MKFLSRFKRKAKEELPPAPLPPAPAPYSPDLKTSGPAPVAAPALTVPKKPSPDELVLELGDFLHRIPPVLLAQGPHDVHTELRFEISELSRRINKGQTTIALSEIHRRCPHIFRGELGEAAESEIRFPWQKLAKLVSLARPNDGSAPADPAVESLAQKLKASRAKNAKPAPPSAEALEAAKPKMPILPGRSGNKASWFSRPTVDKPADLASRPTPAGEPPSKTAPVNRPPVAPAAGPAAPARPAPAVPPTPASIPAPAALSMLSDPAGRPPNGGGETPVAAANGNETAPKVTVEDLRLAELPVDLQRKIAVVRGDYERQISDLDRRCKTTAEARDRMAADLEKLRRDYERAQQDIGTETTVTAMSREQLQKVSAEKEALHGELETLKRQLAEMQDQSKVAELMAERDALLQQKTYLSSQNAELMKKGGSSHPVGNGGGSIQSHRQVEDYQRRIAAMEANQREAALQIAREKEARGKAEKLLAAADKLQEESANYMETAKNEMRRELEAGVRLRELEFRKAQKELQDQIAALTNEGRKASAELENARAGILELEAKLAAPPPATTGPDPMQAQFVEQLEADIETYRDRLKVLLRERDEARAQGSPAVAPAEVEELRGALKEKKAKVDALQAELNGVRQDAERERGHLESRAASLLSAVEGAQQSFTEKRAGLEPALADVRAKLEAAQAEATTLRAQLEELRARYQRDHAALDSERQQAASNLREQSVALEQQLTVLVRERDELRDRAEALAAELKDKTASHEEFISMLEKDHTSVVQGHEDLSRRLAESEEAFRKLEAERKSAAISTDATAQQEMMQLHAELEQARRALDEAEHAAKGRAEAMREQEAALGRAVSEHQREVGLLAEEKAGAARLAKQLADEQTRTSRLADHLAAAETALTTLREQHAEDMARRAAEATGEHTSTISEIEKRTAETVKALERERDQARQEHAAAMARVGSLEGEVRAWEQKLQDAQHAAGAEATRLSEAFAAAQTKAAGDEKALGELKQHAAELEARLTRAEKAAAEAEATAKALSEQVAAAQAEGARLQGELAGAATAHRELEAARAELQTVRGAHQELSATHEKALATTAAAHRDLESVRGEVQTVRSAHEELSGTHQAALAAAASAKSEWEEKLRKVESVRAELTQAFDGSEREANVLRQELEEARKAASAQTESARRAAEALQEKLSATQSEISKLQEARGQLTTELEHARAETAGMRAEREQKAAALAVLETQRAEVAQSLERSEKGAAGLRKELDELRASVTASAEIARRDAETTTRLQGELEAARAESAKLRQTHAELGATIERSRAEADAARAALEQKLKAAEASREEVTQSLSRVERDGASLRHELEEARAASAEASRREAAAAAALRRELEEARRSANTAAEAARRELEAARREIEAAKNLQRELQTVQGDLQQARNAQAELTGDLDKMRAAASAARGDWEQKLATAAAETRSAAARLDEERTARAASAAELSDLRRDLAAAREESDHLAQQRDDLLRRLSRITDEHRSLLDEISPPSGAAAPRAARPSTPTPTVIEVEPEVFTQETEKTVNLPRIRPVQIPPPRVGNF